MNLSTIESLFSEGITLPLGNPVAIFFTVMAMILVAPLLLQRLHIPNIVGMILAGIAIGPYCLNLLDRDASFEVFGQVGILYLMFLAGVEIDMLHLRRNWRKGLWFGFLSFLLPLMGCVVVCHCLMGMRMLTTLLIGSMLASHTLISYPSAAKFGLTGERSSIIAVSGTIVAVLLALMLLAEVVDIDTHGQIDGPRLTVFICSIAVYAFLAWQLLTYATRWFFRHFNDTVTQFVFIMAEVLFSALVAQAIGLEGILGAFYAGLVLNRFIPTRSGLMTRIEFVGSAVFIPYFLIGVGMLMNVGVIFRGWNVLSLALCMSATALAGKWLAAFMAQKAFRLSSDDRRLMFGLTAGKAAATIAATILGFKYGLVNEDVMNGAVIMILICCAVASIMTERAAKGLRLTMTKRELSRTSAKNGAEEWRPLVAVANPMTAGGLVRLSALMRPSDNHGGVTALFVRNSDDGTVTGMGRSSLKEAVKTGMSVDTSVDDIERFDIGAVVGISSVSKERHATEIIMGLHRRSNVVDSFLGSITEQLLHSSNRMIVLGRCFVPLNTLERVVVLVPAMAEFETGFPLWVNRICTLSKHIGAKILFLAREETIEYLRQIVEKNFHLETVYRKTESWDDFITFSAEIDDDEDLFVAVSARQGSLSHSSDMDSVRTFLSRYMSRHNLIIIYPEQYGAKTTAFSSMADLGAINQHTL